MSQHLWETLADLTIKFEGGGADAYSACNEDAEYEGLFDRPKKDSKGNKLPPSKRKDQPGWEPHWASRYKSSGGSHIGLSWGAWQFTQDGGGLGNVLARMSKIDRAEFDRVFGGPEKAQQLLLLTNADGDRPAARQGGARSPRVQPLFGADLWKEPWLSMFRAAGRTESGRKAQQQQSIYGYMRPAADVMRAKGWTKPSTLAVLFDIAIQYGAGGMKTRADAVSGSESESIDKIIANLEPNRQERRKSIRAAAKQYDGQNALSSPLSVGPVPQVPDTGPTAGLGSGGGGGGSSTANITSEGSETGVIGDVAEAIESKSWVLWTLVAVVVVFAWRAAT